MMHPRMSTPLKTNVMSDDPITSSVHRLVGFVDLIKWAQNEPQSLNDLFPFYEENESFYVDA
jgi:hypothetical protein